KVNDHFEHLPMFVTSLGHYPIVLGIPWLRRHGPSINFEANTVTFKSPRCLRSCLPEQQPVTVTAENEEVPRHKEAPLRVAAIGPVPFLRLAQKQKLEVFSLTLYEIGKALQDVPTQAKKDLKELVPPEYHAYLDLFDKSNADHLPPHRPYDHRIQIGRAHV